MEYFIPETPCVTSPASGRTELSMVASWQVHEVMAILSSPACGMFSLQLFSMLLGLCIVPGGHPDLTFVVP